MGPFMFIQRRPAGGDLHPDTGGLPAAARAAATTATGQAVGADTGGGVMGVGGIMIRAIKALSL